MRGFRTKFFVADPGEQEIDGSVSADPSNAFDDFHSDVMVLFGFEGFAKRFEGFGCANAAHAFRGRTARCWVFGFETFEDIFEVVNFFARTDAGLRRGGWVEVNGGEFAWF